MRCRLLASISLAIVTLIQASALSQDAKPAQFFEESFGSLYRKVVASRAFEDDLELATQIFDAARTLKSESTAPIAAYLCDRVFSLAIAEPAGYDVALDAMEYRVRILPAEAEVTRQRTEQALRRAYARERGDARTAVGIRLADYLVMLGDLQAASSDFGGAARLYLQAQRFAGDVESPNLESIKAKAAQAVEREQLEQRIDQLQERFAKGTSRTVSANDLVQIYLLEFNQPSEAAKYVEAGDDQDAKRLVPLLLKDPQSIEPPAALELGQWCETIAQRAPARTKLAWYWQSRNLVELFHVSDAASELDRLRASLALKRIKAEILKLDPAFAKTVAPLDEKGQLDLLADIALDRFKVRGFWRKLPAAEPPAAPAVPAVPVKVGDGGVVSGVVSGVVADAMDHRAQLMLPVCPDSSYELTLDFMRSTGDGDAIVLLPVGNRVVRLVLGGWAGKASGLYPMASDETGATPADPTTNKTTATPHSLTNDKVHRAAIRVEHMKVSHAVSVEVDGVSLIRWTGTESEFIEDPEWSMWQPLAIGLAAQRATIEFKNVKLKPLRGDGRILPKPQTLAERGVITVEDGAVDLFELWDNRKDTLDGTWSITESEMKAVPGRQNIGRTSFPVAPSSDYSLHVEFTRGESNDFNSPIIYLPWGDQAVMFLSQYDRRAMTVTSGLATIDGAPVDTGPASVQDKGFAVGKKVVFDARLKLDGEELSIEIDLDGKPYTKWKGDPQLLAVPDLFKLNDNRTIGLACRYGDLSFEKLHFKSLTADAPLTRQTAITSPDLAAVTDTKPVSPIKLVDIRRDAASGAWQVAGDRLSTEVRELNGVAQLNLPVQPRGDYKLRFQFTPTVGRPVLHVFLPVAGTAVQLDVGRSHGKFSSLRAVGGRDALDSSDAVRVTNNRTYVFDVQVEYKDAKVAVKVSADGKQFLAWNGAAETLPARANQLPAKFNIRSVGVGIMNDVVRSGAVISNVQLQMTRGTPNPIKPAADPGK